MKQSIYGAWCDKMDTRNGIKRAKTMNQSLGFFGLLTLILIVLKVTGLATFSWWWVLAAFCAPLIILSAILSAIAMGLLMLFIVLFSIHLYEGS